MNQTKEKLVVAGLDSSLIGSLSKKLLHVYHSALVSMPDHLLWKCNPTNAPCEASETSVRNMILCICCILNMWSYVCTEIDLVPSEFYFDAKKASPGCIVARQLIAKSHDVLVESIQFLAGYLYSITNDMAVFVSWLGGGGKERISDKEMTAVVTKETTSNVSYNCHYQHPRIHPTPWFDWSVTKVCDIKLNRWTDITVQPADVPSYNRQSLWRHVAQGRWRLHRQIMLQACAFCTGVWQIVPGDS